MFNSFFKRFFHIHFGHCPTSDVRRSFDAFRRLSSCLARKLRFKISPPVISHKIAVLSALRAYQHQREYEALS
jgi:hypothetical protein